MTMRPLIVKIGGAGVDDPLKQTALWRAIAEARRVLDGALVLIHGGGAAVDRHLKQLGHPEPQRIAGLRVTPETQIDDITAVLAGRVNKAIVGAINALKTPESDLRAVGLSLGDGRLAAATFKRGPEGQDLGRVGQLTRQRADDPAHLLNVLLAHGFLPVLCSIALADDGRPLNVNADDAAAEIAYLLNARGLVLLTDVPGILDETGALIPRINPDGIARLIDRGVIKGGMIPKAAAAARAAASANAPATIASWNTPDDLVRIARGEPAGTTVTP